MNELANTLADIIECKIGDKVIKIKKVTLGILAEFSQRMFEQKLNAVISTIKDSLTPAEIAEIVDELSRRRSAEIEIQSISSLEGMVNILKICAEAGGTSKDDLAVIENMSAADMPILESIINMATDAEAAELIKND